jgi:hypothetical protein
MQLKEEPATTPLREFSQASARSLVLPRGTRLERKDASATSESASPRVLTMADQAPDRSTLADHL